MKMVVMTPRLGLGSLVAAAVALVASGCGPAAPTGATVGADQVSIVTAAYPFQFVAERVAGSHGQVSSLTQPGSEPHDLELTPQQTASVVDAGLVVYEKTFQAAVDEAVAQSGRDNVLDTTTVVPLQDLGTGHDHEHAEQAEGAEHAEDDHAEENGL